MISEALLVTLGVAIGYFFRPQVESAWRWLKGVIDRNKAQP